MGADFVTRLAIAEFDVPMAVFDFQTLEGLKQALEDESLFSVRQALVAQAETAKTALEAGSDFESLGLTPTAQTDLTRDAVINGTPSDMLKLVFDAAPGDIRVVQGDDTVIVLRVDGVTDAQESAQNQQLLAQLAGQLSQQLSQDIFAIYSDDVVRRAVPLVDQQAVNAVHVNFP